MVWFWLVKGGPVMIPILLGSIVGLAVVIERILVLAAISAGEGQECLDGVLKAVRQGRLKDAAALAGKAEHPIAAVLRRGLEQWDKPPAAVERAMEQAALAQVRGLERWLGTLASLVAVEPMLGFLGTITGLIRAFMAWESAGSRVTVSLLAAGIYEAMITTAAGLIIAIPLLLAHNAFVSRIKRISAQLIDGGNELLQLHEAHLDPLLSLKS